jgi:DNA polymerase III subunit delta
MVKNINRASAKARKVLERILAEELSEDNKAAGDQQPAVIYIFTASDEKINRGIIDRIREAGIVKKLKTPAPDDLMRWLEKRASSDSVSFTAGAKALLVENVNLDMKRLENEYNKLFDYISSEDKKEIDTAAVKNLVSRTSSMKIFDIVDYIGERDKNKSMKALEDVLREDKNLLGLTTLLHRMFKSMLYTKTEGGRASITDYLSENIKMPPYFIGKMVNKYIKFSKNYSLSEIIRIFGILNDYDINMRTGTFERSKLSRTIIARITDISS